MTQSLSRRGLLTATGGSVLGLSGCSGSEPREASVVSASYGDDPSQYGELYLPARIPLATVVVIHGGY